MQDGKHLKLHAEEKKEVVNKFMEKLMEDDPSLYYASAAEVARDVYEMMQKHHEKMSLEEQAVFKHLSVEHIEDILSYH